MPIASLSDRLRAILDIKARGRLRVGEVVVAHRTSGLSWVGANGWTFVLDAPPDVHLSARDSERAAARFDLTVRDEARVVFRDRILAWDGTPVMVADGTKRTELVDGLTVEVDNFREDPVLAARMDIEHTVKVVTNGGTQPHVKAKPGTVSTFYGIANDGWIQSFNATYATALSGSNLSVTTSDAGNIRAGQDFGGGIYLVYEGFIGFDTSAVSTDTVSAVTLSLWLIEDNSITDHTSQARLLTWSAGGLTTADWVATLNQTLLATIASNGIGAAGSYKNFTSEAAFTANINGSGNTEMVLCSDRTAAATTPSGNEFLRWDDADTAGTTQDPKLVVTHAASATSPAFKRALLGVGV